MGSENKPSFGESLKAKLAETRYEAAKAASAGFEKIKDTTAAAAEGAAKVGAAAADGAAKAGHATLEAMKDVGGAVATGASTAKDYVDDKTREALDNAYAAKRHIAVDKLVALRKAHPGASPGAVLDILEKELTDSELKSGAESEGFSGAAALYALTAVEIHGELVANATNKQRLVDAVVVIDSETAKNIALVGGLALTLVAGRFSSVGKAAKLLAKVTLKVAWLKPIMSLAGIENPGQKSAAWVLVTASHKVLGPAPESWQHLDNPTAKTEQ